MTTPLLLGPRERALHLGLDALNDTELVALVLGTGGAREPVGVLASRLLASCGGLAGLARAGLGELANRGGVGPAKAARLAAAIEIGKRMAEAQEETKARLPDPAAVHAWAAPRLARLEHEELWLLSLDGKNGLRAARRVAQGGLHGLQVSTRDVLRTALREAASGFVLVHNHPSGDPTPSALDARFTREVARAGHVVDTPLVDHVVVAREGYVSMFATGVLDVTPGDTAA
jgi:DNA repair protein RadC